MTAIDDLARRFAGIDILYRRDGFDSRCIRGAPVYPWRARLVTSKNERSEYRVTAYGMTREEAELALLARVEEMDRKPIDPATLVSFDDEMKKIYPPPGQPMTADGKALLERMEAERAARNAPIASLIDERGRPTDDGLIRLLALSDDLHQVVRGHDDNTGASCRVDLDGHDCCYVCNRVEDMLRATARYYEDA